MTYWKVKDMTSGNQCKDGIGYEGIFYFNKFDSKEEALEFIKSLPRSRGGYVKPYKIFRFEDKKGAGKGWHGDTPGHRKAALKAERTGAIDEPINTAQKENTRKEKYAHFIIEEDRMGNITLWHTYSPKQAFFQFEADKEAIYDLLKKGEKKDLDNGWAVDVYDNEPRASVLQELLDAAGEDKKWKYYSILDTTTGELLETGRNSTSLKMAVEYGIEFIGEEFEDDDWEEYRKMSLDEKGELKYFMEKSDGYVIVGHDQKFLKTGGELDKKDYQRVDL